MHYKTESMSIWYYHIDIVMYCIVMYCNTKKGSLLQYFDKKLQDIKTVKQYVQ